MFNLIRKLWRPKEESSDGASSWDPRLFVYVKIPGDIEPLARGERFEDPLDEALKAANLGHVSGGGSQMDAPYPDGSPRVEFCGIDVDVVELEAALAMMRQKLVELSAPEGTELHYTTDAGPLLDSLGGTTWTQRLARTVKHPGFGV